ncbi:MAG: PIN domain-containing protein [Geodermatophilaceae bacterium]|nr:PIN domain-containing protein [Geodermatophilaceae bacterium]
MAARLITADTSVVVAGLTGWHEAHQPSLRALRGITRLPGHVLVETTSVLTRLPGGRAIAPTDVVHSLRSEFAGAPLCLSPAEHHEFLEAVARSRIVGGSLYDALVGFTAGSAGALLRTRDRRAQRTYEVMGVEIEKVG